MACASSSDMVSEERDEVRTWASRYERSTRPYGVLEKSAMLPEKDPFRISYRVGACSLM